MNKKNKIHTMTLSAMFLALAYILPFFTGQIPQIGSMLLPMDEALVLVALDFSGRAYLNFDVDFPDEYKLGDMDVELIEEYLLAFVRNAEITLHVKKIYGKNNHHVAEGIFKGFARALKQAVAIDEKNKDILPSTKGVL